MLISTIGCYIVCPLALYIMNRYINNKTYRLIQSLLEYLAVQINKCDSVVVEDNNIVCITIKGNKKRISFMIRYILNNNVYCTYSSLTQINDIYTLNLKVTPRDISNSYQSKNPVDQTKASFIII